MLIDITFHAQAYTQTQIAPQSNKCIDKFGEKKNGNNMIIIYICRARTLYDLAPGDSFE